MYDYSDCEFHFISAYDYEVPAMGKLIAKTDIQIQLPEGCYGRVAPRSGLAANHHIDIGGNCHNFKTCPSLSCFNQSIVNFSWSH